MRKILVFSTFGGLCNQFSDIRLGIVFAEFYGYKYTFRNCSFRDRDNLQKWYYVPFENLFDISGLRSRQLFIEFNELNDISEMNCYNLVQIPVIQLWGLFDTSTAFKEKIDSISEKYVCIAQLFGILAGIGQHLFHEHIPISILPCTKLKAIYEEYRNNHLPIVYDSLHYRYEYDFKNHFGIKIIPIDELLCKFSGEKQIYVATCRKFLTSELVSKDFFNSNSIINKDEYMNQHHYDLNYEENAMLDYCICCGSDVFYGHSMSSFSHEINIFKNSNNFYA